MCETEEDRLRCFWLGLVGGLWLWSLLLPFEGPTPNRPLDIGVVMPDTEDPADFVRRNASDAARSSRFVVPSALVDAERAEQTMATLLSSI